jgi:hypothetical protein
MDESPGAQKELLLVAEELAEWVERVRAERPETE